MITIGDIRKTLWRKQDNISARIAIILLKDNDMQKTCTRIIEAAVANFEYFDAINMSNCSQDIKEYFWGGAVKKIYIIWLILFVP